MSGIVPNTLDSELNPPGRETTIISNLVVDNNNYDAPTNRFGLVARGMGIVVPGRVGDIIEKNIVINHDKYGIVASPMLDAKLYFSQHVQVIAMKITSIKHRHLLFLNNYIIVHH